MQTTSRLLRVSLTIAVLVIACEKRSEPQKAAPEPLPPAVQSPATASGAASPARHRAAVQSALEWQAPARLEPKPSKSRMRLATYRIPRAPEDAEDGELTVFHFGAKGGGGVEPNIERWIGQFSDVARSDVIRGKRTVNGLTHHSVEIRDGTFSSGPPMGAPTPKKNFAMIAVVVESPGGLYFFKATGPKATLKSARDDVQAFFGSIRMKTP